jgi:biopolymer transport protein ExbD
MSKFKNKKGTTTPAISTASLPDIVFMLLFFFMVVTVIREKEILVDITLPEASEITKLLNARKAEHIYIGKARGQDPDSDPMIQINDKFTKVDQIRALINDPSRQNETVALQVDEKVSMGIVKDVKTEIRKAERLKLHYIAYKDMD